MTDENADTADLTTDEKLDQVRRQLGRRRETDMATTSTARPKWINDPLTATIGRIVMLEERVAECERQREQITRQDERIKILEERLLQLTRPRELLTEKEAAELLRVHIQTLRDWRKEHPAPRIPFILMEGGDVRYRMEMIEAYLKSRERGAAKKGPAQ